MTIPATTTRGLDVRPRGALSIGAVLDTGVASLPAPASHAAGPASLVAWVALLALSVPLAVTFAALGRATPTVAACRRTPAGPSVRVRPWRSVGSSSATRRSYAVDTVARETQGAGQGPRRRQSLTAGQPAGADGVQERAVDRRRPVAAARQVAESPARHWIG